MYNILVSLIIIGAAGAFFSFKNLKALNKTVTLIFLNGAFLRNTAL